VQVCLEAAEEDENPIHSHGGKSSSSDSGAVRRVAGRADHAVVVGLEERADDGEDDDGEDGEDEAAPRVHQTDDGLHGCDWGATEPCCLGCVTVSRVA